MSQQHATESQQDHFQCVVCGSESHGGEGWIFPTEDTEVVELSSDGVERELGDDPRPICSIGCKDKFEETRDYGQ